MAQTFDKLSSSDSEATSSSDEEEEGTPPALLPPTIVEPPPPTELQQSLSSGGGVSGGEMSGLAPGGRASDVKERKYSSHRRPRQPKFGICFDIDGVLARGTVAIPAAVNGIHKLLDEAGKLRYPVAFVTNALNTSQDKANQLTRWFGATISKEQMIQSPSPLEVFEKFHNKFCLVVGQGKILEIAKELGFTNLCTIEDVSKAYPLLDVVDHDNRHRIDREGGESHGIPRIEVILLLGEPKRWESSLQVLTDILVTDGQPDKPPTTPDKHLPVIACNMDLRFMERAHIPRFGHGAFLVCFEALYKKVTGYDLQYTALVGKPSEITFRFAEHVLTREALKLGFREPLKTIYVIGDNPESDIVGSNLYQRYIDRMKHRRRRISVVTQESRGDPELPDSRNVPSGTKFNPQTVDNVEAILVCTGIYQAGADPEGDGKNHHGHRDFPKNTELNMPTYICDDANSAIEYILQKEGQGHLLVKE